MMAVLPLLKDEMEFHVFASQLDVYEFEIKTLINDLVSLYFLRSVTILFKYEKLISGNDPDQVEGGLGGSARTAEVGGKEDVPGPSDVVAEPANITHDSLHQQAGRQQVRFVCFNLSTQPSIGSGDSLSWRPLWQQAPLLVSPLHRFGKYEALQI